MHKRRKKLLLASLLLIPGAFLLGAALVVAGGLRDDIRPADVAIVPGNTVESDGRPSARLRARLDKAAELYRGGLFRHVIVSGGTGVESYGVRPVYSAHADYFELRDVYSVAREVIGYGAYLMRRYDVVRGPR